MTLTTTSFPMRDRLNDRMVVEARYAGPAAYVAGGDPVNSATELGMAEVYGAYGLVISNGSAIRVGVFVYSTQKLQWFVPNTGAEASGDLSAFTGTICFHGKG